VTAPTGDGVVSVPVAGGLHAPTVVAVRAEDLEPGDRVGVGAEVLHVGSRNGLTVVTIQVARPLIASSSRITVAPDVLFEVIR
jgi:hypothetical protein